MSDWRMALASLIAAIVASCALGNPPLLAQDLTAFRRRLDAAYAEAAAKRVADSLSNLALRQAPGDSARIGPVSLVVHGNTPFSASAIASQAAALIGASSLAPLAPEDRSYHLGSSLTGNRNRSRPLAADDFGGARWEFESRRSVGAAATPLENYVDNEPAAQLATRIARDFVDRAATQLPPRFTKWLDAAIPDSAVSDLWELAYTALATSPTLAARRCLLGDLAGCRIALHLDSVADPVQSLLTAPVRRELAARIFIDHEWARNSANGRACVDARQDAACLSFLRQVDPGAAFDADNRKQGRQALVVVALGAKQAPGFKAVVGQADLPPDAALRLISGESDAQLLERWHQRVMAARPRNVTPDGRQIGWGLGWIVVFSLAGVRGTRWI